MTRRRPIGTARGLRTPYRCGGGGPPPLPGWAGRLGLTGRPHKPGRHWASVAGIDSLKQQLEQLLRTAVSGLVGGILPEAPEPAAFAVERTRDPKHGDFATNIALRLAKPARRSPRELAQAIIDSLPPNSLVAPTQV